MSAIASFSKNSAFSRLFADSSYVFARNTKQVDKKTHEIEIY